MEGVASVGLLLLGLSLFTSAVVASDDASQSNPDQSGFVNNYAFVPSEEQFDSHGGNRNAVYPFSPTVVNAMDSHSGTDIGFTQIHNHLQPTAFHADFGYDLLHHQLPHGLVTQGDNLLDPRAIHYVQQLPQQGVPGFGATNVGLTASHYPSHSNIQQSGLGNDHKLVFEQPHHSHDGKQNVEYPFAMDSHFGTNSPSDTGFTHTHNHLEPTISHADFGYDQQLFHQRLTGLHANSGNEQQLRHEIVPGFGAVGGGAGGSEKFGNNLFSAWSNLDGKFLFKITGIAAKYTRELGIGLGQWHVDVGKNSDRRRLDFLFQLRASQVDLIRTDVYLRVNRPILLSFRLTLGAPVYVQLHVGKDAVLLMGYGESGSNGEFIELVRWEWFATMVKAAKSGKIIAMTNKQITVEEADFQDKLLKAGNSVLPPLLRPVFHPSTTTSQDRSKITFFGQSVGPLSTLYQTISFCKLDPIPAGTELHFSSSQD